MKSTLMPCLMVILTSLGTPLWAQTSPHDPNLPTVKPEALQQLSDERIRQQIMEESQARYGGRCVCLYMTTDTSKRSCKGRHELIRTKPRPICYPREVTNEMVSNWQRQHP